MKAITSAFAGRCATCRKPYAKGEVVNYQRSNPRGSRIWHTACAAPNAPSAPQGGQGDAPAVPAGQYQPARSTGAPLPASKAWPARVHRQAFDSVAAAVEFGKTPNPVNQDKWDSHDSGEGYGKEDAMHWYGVPGGLKEVKAILAAGTWDKGVARMMEAMDGIAADLKPRSIRRTRVRRDFGHEVDITEYWRGRGDVAWTNCERQSRNGPQTVTVAVNIAVNANVHGDAIFWRGAAALCLADKLTQAGYNVEIIAINTARQVSQDGKHDAVSEILLKPATAPLDLNNLATVACLPGFFRVAMFKVTDGFPFKVSYGLGRSIEYRELIGEDVDPRAMFIADGGALKSAEGARQWVEDSIRSLEAGGQGDRLAA